MSRLVIVTKFSINHGMWLAYYDGTEPNDNGQMVPLGMGECVEDAIQDLEENAQTTRK